MQGTRVHWRPWHERTSRRRAEVAPALVRPALRHKDRASLPHSLSLATVSRQEGVAAFRQDGCSAGATTHP